MEQEKLLLDAKQKAALRVRAIADAFKRALMDARKVNTGDRSALSSITDMEIDFHIVERQVAWLESHAEEEIQNYEALQF